MRFWRGKLQPCEEVHPCSFLSSLMHLCETLHELVSSSDSLLLTPIAVVLTCKHAAFKRCFARLILVQLLSLW